MDQGGEHERSWGKPSFLPSFVPHKNKSRAKLPQFVDEASFTAFVVATASALSLASLFMRAFSLAYISSAARPCGRMEAGGGGGEQHMRNGGRAGVKRVLVFWAGDHENCPTQAGPCGAMFF